jgi:hypothetical protein
MNDSAESLAPEADEAIRAYIRKNRARLAQDNSFIVALLPERFADGEVEDIQRHIIDRLRAENTVLKAKLEAVERAVKAWGAPPKA